MERLGERSGTGIVDHLWTALTIFRNTNERRYTVPESEKGRVVHNAMEILEKHALDLVTSGCGAHLIADQLGAFMPGTPIHQKVDALLNYNTVLERLELSVAEEVINRLSNIEYRIAIVSLAYSILQRSDPSPTATKYLQRASKLFLAGYDGEIVIMCGAVLEAALRERIPDEVLLAAGKKSKFKSTGSFALSQRTDYELRNPFLSPEIRKEFWAIVNWRNDAVHVQLDIGPTRSEAPLLLTAVVLGAILPRAT